jgi:hypothetical protein
MTKIVTASNTIYTVDMGSMLMLSVWRGRTRATFREDGRVITVGPVKAICD